MLVGGGDGGRLCSAISVTIAFGVLRVYVMPKYAMFGWFLFVQRILSCFLDIVDHSFA